MSELLSRADVLRLLQVSDEFLLRLEREALVAPERKGYSRRSVDRIRICWNLQRELGVNTAGQEVILNLLERIERERRQFQAVLGWLRTRLEGE